MKVINTISRWLSYIGIGLVVMLMLLTVSNVFMRFVFNSPITGTTELTELAMVCLTLGVAWCAIKRRHITVDIFIARFPPQVQKIIGSITLLASLGIFAIIAWRGIVESLWVRQGKYVASVLMPVPKFPVWWLYVLGLAMLCLVLVTILIQKIKGVSK